MKKSAKALMILAASAIAFIVLSVVVFSIASPRRGQTSIDKAERGKTITHTLKSEKITKLNLKSKSYGQLVFNIVADGRYSVDTRGEYDKSININASGSTLNVEIDEDFSDYLSTDITIHVGNELSEITSNGECFIVILDLNSDELTVDAQSNRIDLQRTSLDRMNLNCNLNSWETLKISGEATMVNNLTIASQCDVIVNNEHKWIGQAVFNENGDYNYTVQFIGQRPKTQVNPLKHDIGVYFSKPTSFTATDQPVREAHNNDKSIVETVEVVEEIEADHDSITNG